MLKGQKIVYWHRELPPLDAEPLGEHTHVLDETIGSKHDYHTGEVWLHGRFTYLLLRRGRPTSATR